MIHWLGLTGILALFSYMAAVFFSPLAYPGYNWMAQEVSDLSAEAAPSRPLWNRLASPYILAALYARPALLFLYRRSVFHPICSRQASTCLWR